MTFAHGQLGAAETANIKIRPPVLLIVAVVLGLALDHILPLPFELPRDEGWMHKLIPSTLLFLGLAISAASVRNFSRSGTPVPGNRPVRTLVTEGIHRWSRNPMYVGMLLIYLGIGVGVRSLWILALTPLIIIALRYAAVGREEMYLEQRFGDSYRDYKARVRRWL